MVSWLRSVVISATGVGCYSPQETLAAIDLLSSALECQASQFSFAGVKDKKAVTTQTMTVRDVTADR